MPTTSSDVTVSSEPTFTVSPLLDTAAVIVTEPATTPVAWQPADVELTVAIPVLDEEQVQLADSPATPPEALTAKTTLFPTATEAEAGAIVAVTGGGGGVTGGAGETTSTSSPHAATPSARSPAIRAERCSFMVKSPSWKWFGCPSRHPVKRSAPTAACSRALCARARREKPNFMLSN